MGEAKRRARATADIQTALEQAHAEGQGIWQMETYHCDAIPCILIGAGCGDKKASDLAQAVVTVARAIHSPPEGKGTPLCLTCDAEFTPTSDCPEGFTVLRGMNPDARQMIVNMLCSACFHHPDAFQRTFDKIKQGLVQDARLITVGDAGNA